MVKFFVTLILIFFNLLNFPVQALDIPTIVIAPNKSPQSYSTVGSSITSVDSETIENSNNFFLGEVLHENLPGMNYFRSGGYGTVPGIQLRGLPKGILLFTLTELKCQIHLQVIIVFIFQIS